MTWKKSSYSPNGGENCVEVAHPADVVAVRDTKNRGGGHLVFSPVAWSMFQAQVSLGKLDRPES